MAARFVTSNPALAPLFVAVGCGVVASAFTGLRTLSSDTAVVIDKTKPEPWNAVKQYQNTKLYSPNLSFWQSRAGMADPRAAFMSENQLKATGRAKAKVNEIKQKAAANASH